MIAIILALAEIAFVLLLLAGALLLAADRIIKSTFRMRKK
jgi:hypothetical protein